MKIFLYCLTWLLAWSVTMSFYMRPDLETLIPGSINSNILLITICLAIIIGLVFLFLRKDTKIILRPSRWLWAYLAPLACSILLPFTYDGLLSVQVFIFMILVSVFWQDLLTFGYFQNYMRKLTSRQTTIVIVGTMFGIGHIISILPNIEQILQPNFYLLFFVGYLFAWLREKTGDIYLLNTLHITVLLAAMVKF